MIKILFITSITKVSFTTVKNRVSLLNFLTQTKKVLLAEITISEKAAILEEDSLFNQNSLNKTSALNKEFISIIINKIIFVSYFFTIRETVLKNINLIFKKKLSYIKARLISLKDSLFSQNSLNKTSALNKELISIIINKIILRRRYV